MVVLVVEEPRRGSDEDELREKLRAADGGDDSDHGGDGVAHVGAGLDAEGVDDAEEVVHVGVEGRVAVEVEVVGVDAAGADEVVEDDSVGLGEVREDEVPGGLVCAEPVG